MREHITEAIVLDREGIGEADSRLVLYTEKFGRVFARATSARKIVSKLSAHLEPLTRLTVRLVEKRAAFGNGPRFQVTDAVTRGRLAVPLQLLRVVRELTPEGEGDPALWHALTHSAEPVSFVAVLAALGFDPRHAACAECDEKNPAYFSLVNCRYVCRACVFEQYGGMRGRSDVVPSLIEVEKPL